jgi:hypothetical protein
LNTAKNKATPIALKYKAGLGKKNGPESLPIDPKLYLINAFIREI